MNDSENKALMARIRSEWGPYIKGACAKSSLPEAFLAALIANETGGHENATRFEPGVFKHLKDVQEDRAPKYGRIYKSDLIGLSDEALQGLATSYGLTQIMGYAAVFQGVDYLTLGDPAVCFPLTLRILTQFAQAYWLDMGKDFEGLFRCWNTGRPDGKTYDPEYVGNGLARMALWGA
jgi:hypothetical protein